jgi:hypothetical protein
MTGCSIAGWVGRARNVVPVEIVERLLGLYRDRYFDLNVQHFCEKLCEKHSIRLSYTWVKTALQGAGLAKLPRLGRIVRDSPALHGIARRPWASPSQHHGVTSGDSSFRNRRS